MNAKSLLFMVVLMGLTCAVTARIITVPGDYATIRGAVDAADNGDIIEVADGTWKGMNNKDVIISGKEISIRSRNGAAASIIDCEGAGRAFYIRSGSPDTVVIDGFTIRNGDISGNGGGIRIEDASPTITNCIVERCRCSDKGGAVYVNSGDPVISGCELLNNAAIQGGAIYAGQSGMSILQSAVRQNAATSGAGLYASSSPVQVHGCSFEENGAIQTGGAVYLDDCSPFFSDTVIWSNGSEDAAGVFIRSSYPIFTNCWFNKNAASRHGGGVYMTDLSEITFGNCLVSENQANVGSGLFVILDALTEIRNCTIYGNTSYDNGGGIYCAVGRLDILNTIIWNNSPNQIELGGEAQITIEYSDIMGGYPGAYNIDSDPLFTGGQRGAYYLSQQTSGQSLTSPCVDMGSGNAADTVFPGYQQSVFLSDLTTRTDESTDSGRSDAGFHYNPQLPSYSIQLEMPDTYFSPGDICRLSAIIENTTEPVYQVPLFVALQFGQTFWFWDDWQTSVDFNTMDLHIGRETVSIIPTFTWPQTGGDTVDGLVFWGAIISPLSGDLLGGSNGLDQWEFGFGP